MNDQKQQIVDKLKDANNILVTVSSNPSVDQLAACIGLTLLLNKLKKHATAVFSGQIPSTIEFLKPEDTLEKNTDSLRDFIIALDKSKADKLRYKVEENVVKIFITPYRTSISQDDLDFSQGDFNVDVVLCLGVHEQQDLDQAITSHGRILHDAVVASVNTSVSSEIGSINWTEPDASSLSELVTSLGDMLGKELIDSQIATALMTGIVAETGRFSNEKTSPETMRLSAELMAAGANQQLVATKLQEELNKEATKAAPDTVPEDTNDNGMLEIKHPNRPVPDEPEFEIPPPPPEDDSALLEPPSMSDMPKRITTPPSMGGRLTANSVPEALDPVTDPLSLPEVEAPILTHDSLLTHDRPNGSAIQPPTYKPAPDVDIPHADEAPASSRFSFKPKVPASPAAPESLDDLEKAVQSLHVDSAPAPEPVATNSSAQIHIDAQGNLHAHDEPNQTTGPTPDVSNARSAVADAINSSPSTAPLEPTAASGAGGYLSVQQDQPPASTAPLPPESATFTPPVAEDAVTTTTDAVNEPAPGMGPADKPMDMPLPPAFSSSLASSAPGPVVNDPTAPPPVPPPMPPMAPPPGFVNPNNP